MKILFPKIIENNTDIMFPYGPYLNIYGTENYIYKLEQDRKWHVLNEKTYTRIAPVIFISILHEWLSDKDIRSHKIFNILSCKHITPDGDGGGWNYQYEASLKPYVRPCQLYYYLYQNTIKIHRINF